MDYSLIALGLVALQLITLLVWAMAPDTLRDTYREVTGFLRGLFPPIEEPKRRAKAKPTVRRRKRA
jgi:hypothetical protein